MWRIFSCALKPFSWETETLTEQRQVRFSSSDWYFRCLLTDLITSTFCRRGTFWRIVCIKSFTASEGWKLFKKEKKPTETEVVAGEVALSLEKLWSARIPALPRAARRRKEEDGAGTHQLQTHVICLEASDRDCQTALSCPLWCGLDFRRQLSDLLLFTALKKKKREKTQGVCPRSGACFKSALQEGHKLELY